MKWKRSGALAAVVAAAALFAPVAQAGTVIISPLFGCAGGTRHVPAGSDITLRQGWAALNRGLTHAFEVAETTTLTIDGVARADADDDVYRTLVERPDGSWASSWIYPTGITLAAGESFTFVYDSLVSHRIHDGVTKADDHDQSPFFWGPGSIFGGPITCTVTAV